MSDTTGMILEQAGERMSKLSFGKVRWGDQGRQPLLLRWLTDPVGPVGYPLTGQTERIRVLVGEGCDSGRYRKHGGDRRPVYTVSEEDPQEAMEV